MKDWERFTFYYGQRVGWRKVIDGVKYEIIPTNGRPAGASYDMLEDDEWNGEPFSSPEQAAAWLG